MKAPTESSWLNRIIEVLNRYSLHYPSELMENTQSKLNWKSTVDNCISRQVEETWREDIQGKKTLKYINPDRVRAGQAHPVRATFRDSVFDSRRAQLKCRLVTGTYTLQSKKAVFKPQLVDPTCKLCMSAPETRKHFLAECPTYGEVREKSPIKSVKCLKDYLLMCRLLSTYTSYPGSFSICINSEQDICKLELHSRELIHTLHSRRIKLLSLCEGQTGSRDFQSKLSQFEFSSVAHKFKFKPKFL